MYSQLFTSSFIKLSSISAIKLSDPNIEQEHLWSLSIHAKIHTKAAFHHPPQFSLEHWISCSNLGHVRPFLARGQGTITLFRAHITTVMQWRNYCMLGFKVHCHDLASTFDFWIFDECFPAIITMHQVVGLEIRNTVAFPPISSCLSDYLNIFFYGIRYAKLGYLPPFLGLL